MNSSSIYYIHDNYNRPFKVEISKHKISDLSQIEIYKKTSGSDNSYETTPILIFESDQVFVGRSPKIPMTEFSGGYGPKFEGNTILIHLEDNEYVFIGQEIYSFESIAPITEYVSPVGNNDVPYPWAIDSAGNYYLLIEDVILINSKNTTSQIENSNDPYDYYYREHVIVAARFDDEQPKKKNFKNIQGFWIGENMYNMTYVINPSKDYDRFLTFEDEDKKSNDKQSDNKNNKIEIYIIDATGKKIILSKSMFINLIKEFGDSKKFKPLQKTILEKRIW